MGYSQASRHMDLDVFVYVYVGVHAVGYRWEEMDGVTRSVTR